MVEFSDYETEYVFTPYAEIPQNAEILKTVKVSESTGAYYLWIDENMDKKIQEEEISIQEFSYQTDHRGLLKTILKEDVKETDIYFFRMSNDQLLGVQQGLNKRNTSYYGGGVNEKNYFGYQFFMRGLGSWCNTEGLHKRKERIRHWQTKSGVDEELIIAENDMRSDYPRAGEEIKVVAVNRVTGYTGTSKTVYDSGVGTTTAIDVNCQIPVILFPKLAVIRFE